MSGPSTVDTRGHSEGPARDKSPGRYAALLISALFYILVVIGTSAWIYHQAAHAVIEAIDQHLRTGTAAIPYMLARTFHDRATTPKAISAKEDDRNIHRLSDVAVQGNYAFLFTVIYRDGKVFITASSATAEELAAGSEVRYFDTYEESKVNVEQALASPAGITVNYSDRWGHFRGAYVPKVSPDGKRYLACAEVETSYVEALLHRKLLESVVVALLLSLATFPIFLLAMRRDRRHTQLLETAHTRLRQEMAERKVAEGQLIRAHKMEALGTLAGGVAHDFNNILSAINGFTQLALDEVDASSSVASDLNEVKRATRRAKDLIQQIQTFARPDKGQARSVQVQSIAREVLAQVLSSRPAGVQVESQLESTACVRADPTSMHQILMNLCTNAVQAMANKGGVLRLELKDVPRKATDHSSAEPMSAGDAIQITVQDTGEGIPPDNLGSIFEPYFTTRSSGRGTGLGLAVVHGLVTSMGGDITVQSEVGKGSIFTLLLPVTLESDAAEAPERTSRELPRGNEHILIVDDESMVAQSAARLLEQLGYRTTVCLHSEEVARLMPGQPVPFDLIITDLIMPGMTGEVLMQNMATAYPTLPVILCTGYAEKLAPEILHRLSTTNRLLRKPFSKEELAGLVRQVLDHARGSTLS